MRQKFLIEAGLSHKTGDGALHSWVELAQDRQNIVSQAGAGEALIRICRVLGKGQAVLAQVIENVVAANVQQRSNEPAAARRHALHAAKA
jgi:hypothetical protein